jgi:hypothetical protein
LFGETILDIYNEDGLNGISSLAYHLKDYQTRAARIVEKKTEIVRYFWTFYEKHGK